MDIRARSKERDLGSRREGVRRFNSCSTHLDAKFDASVFFIKPSFQKLFYDFEKSIRNALKTFSITTDDAAHIREFVSELRSCKNISVGRANKLTFSLIALRRFIGPFSSNTIGESA